MITRDAIAINHQEEVATATKQFSVDGVDAQHLTTRAFNETDVARRHLIKSLIATQIELSTISHATVAASHGRLPAIEKAKRRVEGHAVDTVVESQPEVVLAVEGSRKHHSALQSVVHRDLFGNACRQVKQEHAIVNGA